MPSDRLRDIYSDQQSVFGGSLRGRLSTRPVINLNRDLTDGESSLNEEDDSQVTKFTQEVFTVESTGIQYLQLTNIPLTNSEHIYWKPDGTLGIYLEEGPDWQTTGVGEIGVAADNLLVGDKIVVEYAYRDAVDFQPTPPMFVGATQVNAGYSAPATTISLPTGTRRGDLLTLGLISGFGVGVACPDPRMLLIDNTDLWSRGTGFWAGYAADLSTPLSIFVQGNYNITGQFATAFLVSWRATIGSLAYNPNKKAIVPATTSTTQLLPGLGGNLSGGICCFRTSAGIGGVYGYQNWAKAPAYSIVSVGDNTYCEIDFACTLNSPVPAQTTPNTNTDAVWVAGIVGLK